MNPSELSEALVQVRRAHRIVHAYQRRMNTLHERMDGVLGPSKVTFQEWGPYWNKRPAYGSFFQPGRWAWDMVPSMGTSTTWVDHADGGKSGVAVVVTSLADSGRWGVDTSSEPDPEEGAWPSPEAGKTVLWLEVFTTSRTPDAGAFRAGTRWWRDVWAAMPKDTTAASTGSQRAVVQHSRSDVALPDGAAGTYVWFEVDVATLVDDAAVKRLLLEPLAGWVAGPSAT